MQRSNLDINQLFLELSKKLRIFPKILTHFFCSRLYRNLTHSIALTCVRIFKIPNILSVKKTILPLRFWNKPSSTMFEDTQCEFYYAK